MKKLASLLLFMFIGTALFAQANDFAQARNVEVSFTYTKQSGFASNQFAVWVEDSQGVYVKTLYATKFTAGGGWKRRALSLPLWVKQSNLAGMDKKAVDALTGATPKNGALKYTWDGTDSGGKALADGEYKVFVEATLRNENSALYTAAVKLGESGQAAATVQYSGSSSAERGMIGPVTVTYR
jgi:hypothetical protein